MQPSNTPARRGVFARLFSKTNASVPAAKRIDLPSARTYMVSPGQPVWMDRDYTRFSNEAYIRNVIAHRAIAMIAQGAGSVRVKLYGASAKGVRKEIKAHALLELLSQPNPAQSQAGFLEAIYQYRLISGNAFIHAVGPSAEAPQELHVLRPDRVAIIAGKNGMPAAYRYTVGQEARDYPINRLTWSSRIVHIKNFHPLNDWYGLSPIEAAAYSIDQHNQAGAWNQALLQNGARPSGALVVKLEGGNSGILSEEQYTRIKQQVDEQFSGPANAGRPLLLEGGLDWKELSMTPKDMDFIECKHSAARDIALAFGVPPQMLGIPGDNTYSNLQEARLALWEQTILPLVESTLASLSAWLSPMFGGGLEFKADIETIPALAARNQLTWERVERASFLTTDEKRAAVGYGPMGGKGEG